MTSLHSILQPLPRRVPCVVDVAEAPPAFPDDFIGLDVATHVRRFMTSASISRSATSDSSTTRAPCYRSARWRSTA